MRISQIRWAGDGVCTRADDYTSPNAPTVRTLNGRIEIPLGDEALAGILGQWNFNMAVRRSDVRGVRPGVE